MVPFVARAARSPPASCRREASGPEAEIARHLSRLCSPDEGVRSRARAALVKVGPAALFQVCPFIQEHLNDPTEHAWRAAYRVEEDIARRCADDPHLDDYYRALPPRRLATRTVTLPGGVTMEFVRIPAGTFVQGSRCPGVGMPMAGNAGHTYSPVRRVTISKPFWIARDEVTQVQWEAVGCRNRSRFRLPDNPVSNVSWREAMEFCSRLSRLKAPEVFTLPTEAQWEYACRAGTTARHAYGNRPMRREELMAPDPDEDRENLFGLRRLHHGHFEWCLDWYGPYSERPAVDPAGPPEGECRTIRDNYDFCSASEIHAAHRVGMPPELPYMGIGVRCVCLARRPAGEAPVEPDPGRRR